MTRAERRFPIRSMLAGAAVLAALGLAGGAEAGAQPYAQAFGGQAQSSVPAPLAPLTDSDARTYAAAFDAVKKGQFGLADSIVGAVQDGCLQGRVQYAKLMHSAYKATYGELKSWLDQYRDQPGADRIFIMAKKRRASEAATPAAVAADAPVSSAEDTGPAEPIKDMDPRLQQSREAFYAGDVNTAYQMAAAGGERWIAGLAAFRLGKFDEAFKWLSDLAQDDAQSEWVRSAAAWWAARSAATAGLNDQAAPYLRMAASAPATFYGLIAAHQLGLDAVDALATPQPAAAALSLFQRTGDVQPVLTPAMAELVLTDPRARRAAALSQSGLRNDAGSEIRTALLGAGDSSTRTLWRGLAAALNAPLTSPDERRSIGAVRFDPAQYDAPDLKPKGGFTLEKALVYAIVRQESRFNADAVSASGAYGLMQLMPATAALATGDIHRSIPVATLRNPAENLRIGQAYVQRLLDSVSGDLIRTVASYNSGPGTILKTVARLGPDADSLLVIESMPGAQTREYVERVMSNYWIYRKLWALPSPSLDAVAAGQAKIPAILDANKGRGAKYARAD